jgi:hypothetical protein
MRYTKDQMGSCDHAGKTLTCSMGFHWPPIEVVAYGSPENAKENVKSDASQRIEVWEKVCGQHEVSTAKCPTCKYVFMDGALVNQSDQGRRGASLRVKSPAFRSKPTVKR